MKIPSHIHAIIFDMDGLLIDSEPYWEKADAALFSRYHKHHNPAINKRVMGMKPREIVDLFKKEYSFTKSSEDLLRERLDLLYQFLLADLSFMPGAKNLLLQLHKQIIPLALATSGHTREKAKKILSRLQILDYFQTIVVGEDVAKGKPAPDIFLKAAERLNISKQTCLVFEDAPNGVEAGKAAGMTVFGINKDQTIAAKLKEAGADEVFDTLEKITV